MSRIRETIRNIFMIPELRRRILVTLGLLAIFRLGAFIPLPGISIEALRDLMKNMEGAQLFGFLKVFSGGALEKMSIFALGIMPYISASIIFQLLVKVIPRLEAIAKEGPSGHRKISQYTRIVTLPICFIQGMFIIGYLKRNNIVLDPTFWGFDLSAICALTAGTMFVMWLGEQISEHGLGNGSSLIIMAGIIADMPGAVADFWSNRDVFGVDKLIFLIVLFVGMVVAVVVATQAQRRIAVQHAKHTRGRRVYGGARHYLPLKVNQAGVMPVIFASSLMVVPITIEGWVRSRTSDVIFSGHGFWYSLVYVGLVFFFSYFWTALFFQPSEMANQLKEHGSFVPGIRPGKNTAEYLERVMNRVTLVGAAFIAAIALMPDLISYEFGVARYITRFMGGTGILIVVGVGLDMMQKVESHLVMRQYDGFLKKGHIRGRRG
ncbi:MAG: preprotein translocase subunit SecY [Planctomycetota bacterium]|nr:preprotein translocase subunit SecY [Planctomycetota bacterium]